MAIVAVFVAASVAAGCSHAPSRPAADRVDRVALFPLENLSGGPDPGPSLLLALEEAVVRFGLDTVSEETVEPFLQAHRVRAIGVDHAVAEAAREELGVDAVLVTSVERYIASDQPRLAVTVRLVSVQAEPRVLWIDGFSRAAEETKGILGLGEVHDVKKLEREAASRLASSLSSFLQGDARNRGCRGGGPLPPRITFRSDRVGKRDARRVAVLPFHNDTKNPTAGDVVSLHFVRQLAGKGRFDVVEPGDVRSALLKRRIVSRGGLSLDDARRVAETVGADLVVSGEVRQFDDATASGGTPKVEFTTLVLDRSEDLVWNSTSRNTGVDKQSLFELGRISTVSELVCRMSGGVVSALLLAQR